MLNDAEFGLAMIDSFDVLIVEDEPVSRHALTALMSARGYGTHAAGSAEDALHIVRRSGSPKVALVDLDLPGMSGVDLIRKLEAADPLIFTVLITAASGEVVDQVRRRYPVLYMRKPLDFDLLITILHQSQLQH